MIIQSHGLQALRALHVCSCQKEGKEGGGGVREGRGTVSFPVQLKRQKA